MSTRTEPIRVYLESGRVWDVAIAADEREKLDSLMWLKSCNAILFKGDGVTVWFNACQAPLSIVDVYRYDVRAETAGSNELLSRGYCLVMPLP